MIFVCVAVGVIVTYILNWFARAFCFMRFEILFLSYNIALNQIWIIWSSWILNASLLYSSLYSTWNWRRNYWSRPFERIPHFLHKKFNVLSPSNTLVTIENIPFNSNLIITTITDRSWATRERDREDWEVWFNLLQIPIF